MQTNISGECFNSFEAANTDKCHIIEGCEPVDQKSFKMEFERQINPWISF